MERKTPMVGLGFVLTWHRTWESDRQEEKQFPSSKSSGPYEFRFQGLRTLWPPLGLTSSRLYEVHPVYLFELLLMPHTLSHFTWIFRLLPFTFIPFSLVHFTHIPFSQSSPSPPEAPTPPNLPTPTYPLTILRILCICYAPQTPSVSLSYSLYLFLYFSLFIHYFELDSGHTL